MFGSMLIGPSRQGTFKRLVKSERIMEYASFSWFATVAASQSDLVGRVRARQSRRLRRAADCAIPRNPVVRSSTRSRRFDGNPDADDSPGNFLAPRVADPLRLDRSRI